MTTKLVLAGTAGLAAFALVTAPASANGRQPPSDAKSGVRETPSAEPSPPTRYCIVDTITGSRIAKRECKTREAWMRENGFDPLDR